MNNKVFTFLKIVITSIFSLLLLTGCDLEDTSSKYDNKISENIVQNELEEKDIKLDYENETDFENDLNNGVNTVGKIVKFRVKKYAPDSALGYNAISGEHLNFISQNDLKLSGGASVIGKVSSYSKFLRSHVIKYEKLLIDNSKIDNSNKINLPMKMEDLTGENCKEVELLLKKSGFNNISLEKVPSSFFLVDPDYSVRNITIDNFSNYDINDYFDKEAKVIIKYSFPDNGSECAINGVGKQCNLSDFNIDNYNTIFYRMENQYKIYYMIDETNKKVINFGVDYGIRSGSYTGDLKKEITINWNGENESLKKEEEREYYRDLDPVGGEIETFRIVDKYYLEDSSGNKKECQKCYSYEKDYILKVLDNI